MVFAALIYAVAGTFLTRWIGSPLVRLSFDQQRYEADFRFSLVRLRENAESVAFYGGEAREFDTFQTRFCAGRRQLVGDHPAPQEADLADHRLFPAGDRLSVHRRRTALFRQGDPARRPDADRLGLRPGAGTRCPSSSTPTPRSPTTRRWSSGSPAFACGWTRSRRSGRRRSRSRSSAAAPGSRSKRSISTCRTGRRCAMT